MAEALSAKKLDTEVGAIGMRPVRHHIHFDDEPEPEAGAKTPAKTNANEAVDDFEELSIDIQSRVAARATRPCSAIIEKRTVVVMSSLS